MSTATVLSWTALVCALLGCLSLRTDSPSMMRNMAWTAGRGSADTTDLALYAGVSAVGMEETKTDAAGKSHTSFKIVNWSDDACVSTELCEACASNMTTTLMSAVVGLLMLAMSITCDYRRAACDSDSDAFRRSAIATSLAAACALIHALTSFATSCKGTPSVGGVATEWEAGLGWQLVLLAALAKTAVAVLHALTPAPAPRAQLAPLSTVLIPERKFAPSRMPAYKAPAARAEVAARPVRAARPVVAPKPRHPLANSRISPALLSSKDGQVADNSFFPFEQNPLGPTGEELPLEDGRVAVAWQKAAAQAAATAAVVEVGTSKPALAADFFGVDNWGLSQFLDAVDKGGIQQVLFDQSGSNLMAMDSEGGRHMVKVLGTEGPEILKALREHAVQFSVQPLDDPNPLMVAGNFLFNLAFTWIPLLFIGGFVLRLISGFFNRGEGGEQGGGGGGPFGGGGGMGNPMNMLNSKSKIQMEPNTGVNFNDVAGCDESKVELTEVVDFLKNADKYNKVGARCPKGVLLEGPPGTGKTLLARACAGEAGVPFISTSGSEFVEMFTGVGASRIRSLFGDAKKNAPCIIFIDEIDAIGRQRSGGGGFATNDEREQTLNQILTEMDGFEGNTGVIVIAATNRGDILDSALLRPGRFDRRVPVDLPDVKGRVEILKVHCRDKPLAPEVELAAIAGRTIGFSGASLANLMNEAAIMAARRGKDTITFDEIDYAIDRLTVGLEKRTGMSTDSRKKLVAYHEAGHAVMAALTPGYDYVAKVTIVPRSNGAGGFTLFTPNQDRMESGMYSLRYLKGQLAVALGGRLAEEVVFGSDQVTTGASNDLQQVKNIARSMVTQWGFSSKLAPVAWEASNRDSMMGGGGASQKMEVLIDEEISKLVTEAYHHCKDTIAGNRPLMDAVVAQLIEKETISGDDLNVLIEQFTGKPALNTNPALKEAMA